MGYLAPVWARTRFMAVHCCEGSRRRGIADDAMASQRGRKSRCGGCDAGSLCLPASSSLRCAPRQCLDDSRETENSSHPRPNAGGRLALALITDSLGASLRRSQLDTVMGIDLRDGAIRQHLLDCRIDTLSQLVVGGEQPGRDVPVK